MTNPSLPLNSLKNSTFPMDMNSSGMGKSEHMIILGDDFAQNLQTKSFRCSFCKRGFSNAQALGGHMNIHRKDRAKLREFSDENLLSLEMSTAADCDEEKNDRRQSRDDDDRAENLKGVPPPLRMPLLEGEDGERRKAVEYSKYVSTSEVDLELRLGPEPHHHAIAKSKP